MSGGFNPEFVAMMNWTNAGGGGMESPFGMPGMGGVPDFLPEDEDEYGTLDFQNKRGTYLKKVNDLVSDPAMLAQFGANSGGYGPEQFEPRYEYERVVSPAMELFSKYSASSNPVEQLIADAYMNGGGALDAESQIMIAWNDPEDPYHAAIRQLPALVDRETGDIDMGRVQKIIDNAENKVLKDDIFPSMTQGGMAAAGTNPGFADGELKSGGEYVTGDDGLLYKKTRVLSEGEEYFEKVGLPSPYETFNPDELTTEQGLNVENQWIDRETSANNNVDRIRSEMQRGTKDDPLRWLPGRDSVDEPENIQPFGGLAMPETSDGLQPPRVFGSSDGRSEWYQDQARKRMQIDPGAILGAAGIKGSYGYGDSNDDVSFTDRLRNAGSGDKKAMTRMVLQTGGNSMGAGKRRAADPRILAANKRKKFDDTRMMDAQITAEKKRRQAVRARGNQTDRDAYVCQLAQMGFTPFTREMNARQRGVFGG